MIASENTKKSPDQKTWDMSDKLEALGSSAFISSCPRTQGVRKDVRPENHKVHERISGGN
jgi:hypothetical protein